ncbi:glycosyl transferase family 90-domain-containing protein [Mycena galericulata]|nr:glycosyl transferase family 90-domain-containing protein [Mycena galericulata]
MNAIRNLFRPRSTGYVQLLSDGESEYPTEPIPPLISSQHDTWDPDISFEPATHLIARSTPKKTLWRYFRFSLVALGILYLTTVTATLTFIPAETNTGPSTQFTQPHIFEEIDPANRAVDTFYARQSTTLAEASARYSLRTQRVPPPNYDLWFRFSQERKCIIDDYDQIHRDFKPFYQLADRNPAYFREMIDRASRKLAEAPAEITIVEVKNGEVFLAGDTAYGGSWPSTFEKFSKILPDMTFLINGRDEPRVVFNYRSPNALEHAFMPVVNDSTPFHIAPRPTAEFFRAQSGCLVPKDKNGFMESVNEEHSFLISSATPGYTTDLYPMLSMAKISPCFSDILFPTEASRRANSLIAIYIHLQYYYERSWWSGKFVYPDNTPWDDKKPVLYWRGMSTGGMILGDNYHHFMRFKLADLGRQHPDLMDISITRFAETLCQEGCDRAVVITEYNITEESEPREDLYQYKYAIDVDGTTFSGRFLGLLRSGSLVFKATLFEEFFNDWLRPFEHYVPVKPDLSDLVQQIRWANENQEEARLIQQRGQVIAQRVLTDDQNDCYFSAVLLEWARLQSTLMMHVI